MIPRFVGPFRVLKMLAENAAALDLPVSWLAHPVFHVSRLLQAEKEPPHLGRAPLVQEPVAENEYAIEATSDRRERGTENTLAHVFWLDGTTTWESDEHLANAQDRVRKYFRGQMHRQRRAARNISQRRRR